MTKPEAKRARARPPDAFTEQKREKMLSTLATGCTYRTACDAAGIPWNTWLGWSRKERKGELADPDVADLVRAARETYAAATAGFAASVQVAADGDWRAAAWILEHRRGDPKARHDERRARWEAEVAAKRAKGEHREQVAVDASDELVERLRKALHGGGQ